MMSEPKAFASLSAGLLARKGAARPAMRRQPLGGLGLTAPSGEAGPHDDLGWNDMGYDVDPEIGNMDPAVDLKPFLSGSVMTSGEAEAESVKARRGGKRADARGQQAELAQRLIVENGLEAGSKSIDKVAKKSVSKKISGKLAAAQVVEGGAPVAAVRSRDKAAFTLRLDADRHLALRLASAVSHQSSQAIMTRLLDEYLASVPEIGELAGRVAAVPPARRRRPR